MRSRVVFTVAVLVGTLAPAAAAVPAGAVSAPGADGGDVSGGAGGPGSSGDLVLGNANTSPQDAALTEAASVASADAESPDDAPTVDDLEAAYNELFFPDQ